MLFHECDNHLWRIGPRQLQDGIRIDGGSDWICLHRTFGRYVVNDNSSLISGLKAYWKYTLLPAEVVYLTKTCIVKLGCNLNSLVHIPLYSSCHPYSLFILLVLI